MGTARIVEDYWNCGKRWDLEGFLYDRGHRWPTRPDGRPMSAAECGANVLHWLDERDSPTGRMDDVTPDMLERRARWSGKRGLLWEALVSTGWIDAQDEKRAWHDYYSLNGKVIEERLKGRARRARERGDDEGDAHPGCEGGTRGGDGNGGRGPGTRPRDGNQGRQPGTSAGDGKGGREPGTGTGDEHPGRAPQALGSGIRASASESSLHTEIPGGVPDRVRVRAGGARGAADTTSDPSPATPPAEAPAGGVPQDVREACEDAGAATGDRLAAEAWLDTVTASLHAAAGGSPAFVRSILAETLERVEFDRGWLASRVASHPPAQGGSLPLWKTAAVRAWIGERDAARDAETAARNEQRQAERQASERLAEDFDAVFKASGYTSPNAFRDDRLKGCLRTGPEAARRKWRPVVGAYDPDAPPAAAAAGGPP